MNKQTSISDDGKYPSLCHEAATNDAVFENFKRHPAYKRILEHLSYEQGKIYLDIVASCDSSVYEHIDGPVHGEGFINNDKYGNPTTFHYPDVGYISPTTLSYVKTLAELLELFECMSNADSPNICEIGVGYGGQCRIINSYCQPASYTLIDIEPALELAKRFLGNFPQLGTKINYKTIGFYVSLRNVAIGVSDFIKTKGDFVDKDVYASILATETANESKASYDLVISNYAFSELTRGTQETYLEKVLLKSKAGYMICNDIAPPSFNSITKGELLERIPGAVLLNEVPLTHPKNYLIVWGNDG